MSTCDEIEELKAATRAAHETIKDLNTAIRQAEKLVEKLKVTVHQEAHTAVDEVMAREVRGGLESLAAVVKTITAEATAKVEERFALVDETLQVVLKTARLASDMVTGSTDAPVVDAKQINGMLVPGPTQERTEYRYQNGQPLSRADRRRTKGRK